MVGHHGTQSDMVKHHCTDILLKNAVHSQTLSYIRLHTVAQNWFLPHMVTQTTVHGRTDNCTWSHKKSSAVRMAYPRMFMSS